MGGVGKGSFFLSPLFVYLFTSLFISRPVLFIVYSTLRIYRIVKYHHQHENLSTTEGDEIE